METQEDDSERRSNKQLQVIEPRVTILAGQESRHRPQNLITDVGREECESMKWITLGWFLTGSALSATNAPSRHVLEMNVSIVKEASGTALSQVNIITDAKTNSFTSADAFCAFLDTVPTNAMVSYVASYNKRYVCIGTNTMTIKDFGKFLHDRKIPFSVMIPDF